MQPEVLYEDEYLMAINKPSGMVVNRGFGAEGDTVQDWLEANFQFSIFNFQDMRSGVVHRLDKETSGVLLIAKTPEVFAELQRQFKEREVEKVYVALVHGEIKEKEGVIEAPIGRMPKNRRRFGVVPGGREAVTRYRVLSVYGSRFTGGNSHELRTMNDELFSLVEFHPKTGRTHQIRVHAKSLGHPVVSDYMYAGRKTTRRDRKWCSRLFLHAGELSFTHPVKGGRVVVEAPLPEDLKEALEHFDTLKY